MVSLVRYRGKPEPDGLYFGPYTSAQAAREHWISSTAFFPCANAPTRNWQDVRAPASSMT